jgi:hypothetical protein
MTRRRPLLLLVSALLFAGWMAWLGYLALTTTRPEVLSRPQFLASQLDIIAEVDGDAEHPKATVTVKQVLWKAGEVQNPPAPKATLDIVNLPHVYPADGWTGPGEYLLALTFDPLTSTYRIAPVLHSPGLSRSHDRPRVYHATEPVLEQYHEMRGK